MATVGVRFTMQCSVCKREFVNNWSVPQDCQMPNPHFEGFRQYDYLMVCPDHVVTLMITRKDETPLVITG